VIDSSINVSFRLCNIFTVKPYIIGDDLKPIVIKKGQVIKYDIKYGGEPEPEVVWEQDGKQIKPDGEKYVTVPSIFSRIETNLNNIKIRIQKIS